MTARKVDKTPVGAETGSDGEELYPDSSRSLDSLRETRLMALLRDMIDAEDGAKAAEALGVSYRTVARAVESGRLTARMSAALETHLLLGGGSAAAQQRERGHALEKHLAALDEELRGGLEAIGAEVKALREEQAKYRLHVERRLLRVEAGMNGSEMSPQANVEPEPTKRRYVLPRAYPQLVTPEAGPDEEGVYGDATPVIVEWRKVRAEFLDLLKTGTALTQAEAKMRMLHLEIAIIEKHELTLPPASFPWGWEDRRDEVRRRQRSLGSAEVDRNRALLRLWLRRILTCGIWRN